MLIRVVDLETTGFEPPAAEVCQIGWVDLEAGHDLLGGPADWRISNNPFGDLFVRTARPIPPETSAIHHIIDEDLFGACSWPEAAASLGFSAVPITAFAAHNAKFERQFITDELASGLPWVCTYKCALRLWPEAPSHSNQALRYWRRPEGLIREIANVAHRAMPDAYVTAFLLRDMLGTTPLETLIQWTGEPALQVRCGFGKHRGVLWTEVDEGFLHWVADRDFDEDVLFTVRHEIERRRAAAEAS